jgi:cytochrome bd-type quinol oxidase subunit 2
LSGLSQEDSSHQQGAKMTNFQFSSIHWKRVLLAGIGVTVVTTALVFLVIGMYAMGLAMQAQGAPDNAKIEAFANQIGRWGTPLLAMLLTVAMATWVARKTEAAARLNSVSVGLIAAITGLIAGGLLGGTLDWLAVTAFVLTAAAGWLGGILGGHSK